jgi:ABC-type nitrate/sulfonate/bicarbonate transport system permease component
MTAVQTNTAHQSGTRATDSHPTLKLRGRNPLIHGRYSSVFFGSIGVLILLVAWQICGSTGIVDSKISSTPSEVFHAEVKLFGDGTIWTPISTSATEVGWGLLLIVILGLPIGIILGRVPVLRQMANPIISILNSVPYVLFLPLIVFWFGLGQEARVLVVLWAGVLPLVINTSAGVQNVDRDYLRVGQVFSVSRLRFFFSILIPAAMPFILTGLRLSIARALVGAIVVEFFLSSNGLGFFVQNATSNFQMSIAMAAIAIMAVAAVILTSLIGLLEKRTTSWSNSQ